jgi:hypothetical protein
MSPRLNFSGKPARYRDMHRKMNLEQERDKPRLSDHEDCVHYIDCLTVLLKKCKGKDPRSVCVAGCNRFRPIQTDIVEANKLFSRDTSNSDY